MKYTLMQKNEQVADLDMDVYFGLVQTVFKIHNPERLPLSVRYADKDTSASMSSWFRYRNIPKTREGLKGFLYTGRDISISKLSLKSFGLNLTDQYWFKPYGSSIRWDEVSFLKNDFSGVPLRRNIDAETPSPDYCTNGNLEKYWTISDGIRFLLKKGQKPFRQQPYNEVIASKLFAKANMPHVDYECQMIDSIPWSSCPCFIDENTEFIPAWEILEVTSKDETESRYIHFLTCMDVLQVPVSKEEIDQMLQFDYMIHNRDRYYGNFGFIRDVNTLKFLGLAPLFDHGNSLWFDELDAYIKNDKEPLRPFHGSWNNCHGDWLNRLTDEDIQDIIHSTLQENPDIHESRIQKIISTVLYRKNDLTIS